MAPLVVVRAGYRARRSGGDEAPELPAFSAHELPAPPVEPTIEPVATA